MSGFVHLRLHSEFDVRKGAARLSGGDSVVARAAALGQEALAVTDTGCLFGAVKFYASCRASGIKPIIGCELKTAEKKNYHLLLLCANNTGYDNLSRLLSRAHENGGWARPQWMTAEKTAGLVALSGARRGEIGDLLLRGKQDRALRAAGEWAGRFPGRFYLEVWRAGDNDDVLTTATAELGRLTELPVAATHPAQCATEDDLEMLDARLCIAHGRQMSDSERERPIADAPYLLSSEAMREKFADLPGALENAIEIAKRCNFMFDFDRLHLPSVVSEGEDAPSMLRRMATAGLERKLPAASLSAAKRQRYDDRLRYEADVIVKMGFADYFLIVTDFIRWAKNEEIPVGPGRGSGAGSLVAYALDITTLDPLAHGLLFERFLNPERVSMPDFDVDFCVDGRDRVIDYVAKKYGAKQVSQIVTFGAIGARNAIRDVGRVLGFPYGYCDRVARMIPDGINVTLRQALKESPEFADERETEDGRRLTDLAIKVEGLPRNIGTHAGGVLITPRPLEEYCPRYVAADTQTLVSQFDMVDIEKIGLVKFDFLGVRTLTIIDQAIRRLRTAGAVAADFCADSIPPDDEATYRLYAAADMIGVFQCESAGMRDLMRRLRPDRFEDIVALMALYRPGPLSSGDSDLYIDRKNGRRPGWEKEVHPVIREALMETYGVFVYQEQVMEAARLMSGYSLGEADLLRRAMGKKKEDEMAAQQARFVDGAKALHNVPEKEATAMFEKISGFAGYGFNKSHAAAYALLSYRAAYLKARHTAAFLAAVLSAEAGNIERTRAVVERAGRLGIKTLAPDINASGRDFIAIDDKTIAYGLRALRGMGEGAIREIEAARGDRPFADLFDFCARAAGGGQLGAAAIELLISAGAFDSPHPNRAAVLETLPAAMKGDRGGVLFGARSALADVAPWAQREKLTRERLALGFCLSGSFYDLHREALSFLPLTHESLDDVENGAQVLLAGVFLRAHRPKKMRGDAWVVTLATDNGGEAEAIVDASLGQELRRRLTADEDMLIVAGEARRRGKGRVFLRARSARALDDFFRDKLRRLDAYCADELSPAALAGMLPPAKGGDCAIFLHYDGGGLSCVCDLGGGYAADRLSCERLQGLPGMRKVKAKFAPA